VSLSGPGVVKVGLVRATAGPANSPRAPCRIEAFDSLLSFVNVAFYDLTDPLEHDAGMHRPKTLRSLEPIAQKAGSLEWATAIAELDLIIGVDSVAVHLAGALGRPVWVLLGNVSDWWWPTASDSSPWYPTARIFRQPMPGDHHGLMASVRSSFGAWLTGKLDHN
jgi:hypothetical protein